MVVRRRCGPDGSHVVATGVVEELVLHRWRLVTLNGEHAYVVVVVQAVAHDTAAHAA
jgi:hypothetical protein